MKTVHGIPVLSECPASHYPSPYSQPSSLATSCPPVPLTTIYVQFTSSYFLQKLYRLSHFDVDTGICEPRSDIYTRTNVFSSAIDCQ